MRRLIAILALLIAPFAMAVDYEFLAGSTSKLITVNLYDTAGLAKTGLIYSDMTITYTRNNGSADVDVTEVTMTMGTWTSGGFKEVDSTNSPGLYQFGLPDAAIATSAESVMVSFKATGTFQRFVQCSIINVDLRGSSYVSANTVQIEGVDATNQLDTAISPVLTDTNAMDTSSELQTLLFGSATAGATASALSTAQSDITSILTDTNAVDTASELQTLAFGSATPGATATALATAQADLDLLDTGAELQTLLFGGSTAGTTVSTNVAAIIIDTAAMDTSSELQTLLFGSATPGATATALATAQADLDLLDTGGELQTLLFGGSTAGTTVSTNVIAVLADTDAMDTSGELQTLLFGSATPGSTASALSTAQSDITAILTDTNAADTSTELQTLIFGSATPGATASALTTAQTDITSILGDTNELQTRFGLMIEADGGDWRFDTNSLEQAPSGGGGGGDATAANQTTIINHLTDIKGATWSSTTDSLEAIANAISAIDVGGGSGNTVVNEDTGGTDTLQVTDSDGNGIQDVAIIAYVASEFAANPRTATIRATATTSADGRWNSPYMMLESGTTYTLYFFKSGVYGPATTNVTP